MGGNFRPAGMAVIVAALSAGCVVPSYHLPAGFSSTYQRQLYGMEPIASTAPSEQGLASIESRPGIFYPTSVYHESPTTAQQAKEKESMEPLFLGSDPISPEKVIKRTSADDS